MAQEADIRHAKELGNLYHFGQTQYQLLKNGDIRISTGPVTLNLTGKYLAQTTLSRTDLLRLLKLTIPEFGNAIEEMEHPAVDDEEDIA